MITYVYTYTIFIHATRRTSGFLFLFFFLSTWYFMLSFIYIRLLSRSTFSADSGIGCCENNNTIIMIKKKKKNYGKILYSPTLQFDIEHVSCLPLRSATHVWYYPRPTALVDDFGLGVNASRITRHLTTGRRRVRDFPDVSRRAHYYNNIIVPPACMSFLTLSHSFSPSFSPTLFVKANFFLGRPLVYFPCNK